MLKKISVIISFLVLAMSGFQIAEAKRFGSGSNHGYTSSGSSHTHHKGDTSNKATKKTNGMGAFGKILTALGLGALLGWLFSAQGMTGLLVVIALIALFIFIMRKKYAQQNTHSNAANQTTSFSDALNTFNGKQPENSRENSDTYKNNGITNGQLSDGTPESVFNHQALNLFNQLQELNNKAGLEKIKGYLTEDLYQSVLNEIKSNDELAIFKDISCKTMSCERQEQRSVASVMFVGLVKENNQEEWKNFEEIWHFTRQDGEHLWQVAGIQQF